MIGLSVASNNNMNAIKYNNKLYKMQDEQQQLIEFEDNYVFKTNPSFQLSQQTSKQLPKSQYWFKTKQSSTKQRVSDDGEQQTTIGCKQKITNNNNNRNKNNSIDSFAAIIVNPQQQQYEKNSIKNSNSMQKRLSQLQNKVNKLSKMNNVYEVENGKLKHYVQFLQDYNMKLKKQLTNLMRKRSIQDQLVEPYMPTDRQMNWKSLQKSPRQQIFQSKYIPKHNNNFLNYHQSHNNNEQHHLNTFRQLHHQSLKLHNKITPNHPQNHYKQQKSNYPSAFTNKYINSFHQLPQKQSPYYWTYKNSKKINNKIKKIIPTSLQSSLLQRQNQKINQFYPQPNFHQFNTFMPVVQQNYQAVTPLHNQYLRQIPLKPQNNLFVKPSSFICVNCSNLNSFNQQSISKGTKNKKTIKSEKNHNNKNSSQFTCHYHNYSKKSKSAKSTIPTRSKTLDHSSRSKNYTTKNSNYINSSKKKPVKYGQKVTISQFCV